MKAKTLAWGVAVIIVAGAGIVLSGVLDPSYKTAAIDQADTPIPAQLIARGKYLAMAADCTACHTSKDGAPFAGGVPIATPFGTIYGSNITPDKKHGIGSWSSADFYRVLHDGIAPGHPVYPAMPYTSYRSVSRADSDAIFAYLRSIQPVPVANKANDVPFPFNIRALLRGWNFLFLRNSLPDASSGSSDEWVRGKYLANGLGHCTECHTPRGALGQLTLSKTLQGGDLGDIHAVGITPGQLAARGWNTADLQHFLAFGLAPQGSAYGEMHDVVHYSTQHLTEADNKALVRYLTGDAPLSPAALPGQSAGPAPGTEKVIAVGRPLYLALCAGCHSANGQGKPNVTVALNGNSTVRNEQSHNLLQVILEGVAAKQFPDHQSRQTMPGFAAKLSDQQAADLANYLRVSFGGLKADIQPADVASVRKQ